MSEIDLWNVPSGARRSARSGAVAPPTLPSLPVFRAGLSWWALLGVCGAALAVTGPRAAAQEVGSAVEETPPDSMLRALATAAGYVAPEAALEDDGRVIASQTEGDIPERSLTLFDTIDIDPVVEGQTVVLGDTLVVYRDAGDLESPATGTSLGRVVYPTGLAVVSEVQPDVASARLVAAYAPVIVGQRVQRPKTPTNPIPVGEQPAGEGLVIGIRDPVAIVAPLAVIFLDLPSASPLAPGQTVALVRRVTSGGRELPEIRIGSARVVDVGQTAATAIVTSLIRSDLQPGDSYRPEAVGSEAVATGPSGPKEGP